MNSWQRYVAIGDSFTEGMCDPGPTGRDRGWADRVAEALAAVTEDFRYANLAIRGRKLSAIFDDQLPTAMAMSPDLITMAGGVNDALRPRWDLADLTDRWERALTTARSDGATVIILTFGQPAGRSRTLGAVESRLRDYREMLLAAARRHGCLVVDFWYAPVFDDPRFWAPDRLHLNTTGHERVAAAVLETLGQPVDDWLAPLPPYDGQSPLHRLRDDATWVGGHLAPWVGRRILRRSSGDGIEPKRPTLAPVTPLQRASEQRASELSPGG